MDSRPFDRIDGKHDRASSLKSEKSRAISFASDTRSERSSGSERTTVSFTDSTQVVVIPNQRQNHAHNEVPPDYLTLAVLSVVCFLPIGICALIRSFETSTAIHQRDFGTAWERSAATKKLSMVGIFLGVAVIAGLAITLVALAVSGVLH